MTEKKNKMFCKKKLYVSIIGPPNSGKSSIVNTLMNRKITAVSSKPNTTTKIIKGIYTSGETQILFLDTPGITYREGSTKNNEMAKTAISDEYLNIFVFPANKFLDSRMVNLSKSINNKIALITKIDIIKKPQLLPMTNRLNELGFQDILYFSTKDHQCIGDLRNFLLAKAIDGEWDYPGDIATDVGISALLIDATKEILFNKLYQELPYEIKIKNGEIKINSKGEYVVYQFLEIKKNAHHILLARIKELSMAAAVNMKLYLNTEKKVHLYLSVITNNENK